MNEAEFQTGAFRHFVSSFDALVAHLYGLSRDEFAHILGAFPLVFPDNAAGQQRTTALLAVYERIAGQLD